MALRSAFVLCALLFCGLATANPAPFDLSGPTLRVVVTRGSEILPASEVPNLAVGDKLWIKADFPKSQSAHYLMVAAFLSGSTNPPPEDWFFPCKTWKGDCARDGLTVTVPKGAQQVMVFLAPETNGDFRTLVDAVRGRPGAFVRASQDLNQAALDRSRLDRYLATIRNLNDHNPYEIKEITPLLARSLGIKVDEKCLDRIPELQASCLMQGQESLILNDGHSQSIVEALTSGPGADLALAASSTPEAGYGYYSPYISSIIDIARIFDSFHLAQYQYIPALASQKGAALQLTLNSPPSFHDPKSVLVIGLPAVEKAQLPPLHAVDPNEIYCASRDSLVLPVEGAPLVFSTGYAHNVMLQLTGSDGKSVYLPASADGTQGGYVVDMSRVQSGQLGESIQAVLRGYWGFEPFSGPDFQLRNAHAANWTLADGDNESLIVGRQDTVRLKADSVSCVDGIMLRDPSGKQIKADWKAVKPDEVEVKVPLQDAQPGTMTLLVNQYGAKQPLPISIRAFSDAGSLDTFSIHAGDASGVLVGTRLDLVSQLMINGVVFTPGELKTDQGKDRLTMQAQDAATAAALKPGASVQAQVTLNDGRTRTLNINVQAPRPSVKLMDKSVQPSQSSAASNIRLANADELPQDARLTFSIRAVSPARFARDQTIEVASPDQSFSTVLTVASGAIRLENSKVALVTLDPAKAFGFSAFGPLQFRMTDDGVAGDWQPLATLVRLPALKTIKCPATPDLACQLSGSDLFLIDSVASDPSFKHASPVPDGFPGYSLLVPRPDAGRLYVKLRDDPSVTNVITLDVQQLPPTPEELAAQKARADAEKAKADAEKARQQQTPPSPAPDAPGTSSSSSPDGSGSNAAAATPADSAQTGDKTAP
ncbi:hypothetical protein [Solimonas marina]|uniref:hypothetical protein n=1 Tax=Solimonas marina TaxID=2714601 RepID=UPI0019D2D69D|nr:hypothetical protein [Solimonas marina]